MAKHKKGTVFLTTEEARVTNKWLLLNAKGKVLGRFAAEIAKILQGKHRVTYTPHVNSGDGVVVINASHIVVTGAKEGQKIYRYYTGHMSGLREVPYRTMKERKPDYIIRHAVQGMMPKTKLARAQLKKLRIYAAETHDQQAQQPLSVEG